MTAAKLNFDKHIEECREALAIYKILENQGYKAEFGLRYVWVASISAIDHYVTELVIEKSTELFADNQPLSPKLLSGKVSFQDALLLLENDQAESITTFKHAITTMVRFESFQRAEAIANGLAYVWPETHKWQKIADSMGLSTEQTINKLNQIADCRNLIAHNADYDESSGTLSLCSLNDSEDTVNFIMQVVAAIESLVS